MIFRCYGKNGWWSFFALNVTKEFINLGLKYIYYDVYCWNRPKKEDGTQEADFISCVAWKNTAENICKYFDKGSLIGIEGKLQTGSYEAQDGTKRYTIDVLVSRFDFLESKGSKRPEAQEPDYVSQKEEDPFSEFGEQVTIDDNFLD